MSYSWTRIRCGRTTENGAQTRLGFALECSLMTFFRRNGAHLPEKEFWPSNIYEKGDNPSVDSCTHNIHTGRYDRDNTQV